MFFMNFDGISNEAVSIFELMKEFNSTSYFTLDLFFVIILDENHRNTIAYKLLSGTMLSEDLESITYDFTQRHFGSKISKQSGDISTIYEPILKKIKKKGETIITSGDIMIEIIASNNEIKDIFKEYGVSATQLEVALLSEKKENELLSKSVSEVEEKNVKIRQSKNKKAKVISGEAEKNLINISEMAENGDIDNAYGNDEVINTIFSILSKRKNNNVVLVGDPGVGKTTTVKHIANVISNGMCPSSFNGKILLLMDFSKLIIGTMYKGLFETKFQSIIDDASKSGKYIFFIDDIDNILGPSTKVSEMPTNTMLDLILSNKNIQFICTTTNECYSKYISTDKVLSKSMTKIELKEKSESELFEIIKNVVADYEVFHNVNYTDKAILNSISLAKKYVKNKALPESSIDLLDEAGAMASLMTPVNPDIEEMKSKLAELRNDIATIENSSNRIEYEKIDELTRKELTLTSELSRLERTELVNQKPIEVGEEYVDKVIAKKIGTPPNINTSDERETLLALDNRIKRVVIGQDEAVDTITKAVKRKFIGVSNQEKPVVLMMLGKTGTGKTLLAKTLANELFGSNDYLVRVDMSEYSDKMSVNKFIGSSPGYVGYEEGGILTEAVKNKSRCVLLLDEIEKANDEIFNLLLQVFDEGRLTDNKGILVNFKDVIIIMTSNVGAKEVSEASGRIGFSNKELIKNDDEIKTRSIIKNAMKHKFPPEFLNRIDKVVWFNDLTDDNLIDIIKGEIKKVSERLEKVGYYFSTELFCGKLVKNIFDSIVSKREYGARPILREIEERLEDKITDLIISGKVELGHVFTENDICL